MPVVFVGIDEGPKALIPNASHYANPRINDPCPHIDWPRLSNSNHAQRIGILTALENLANVESITFLPSLTVIDLTHDDNRIYDAKSLPGIVVGRSTLYHHDACPFINEMRDLKRERRIDPAGYEIPEVGPLPVDCTKLSERGTVADHPWCAPGRQVMGFLVQDSTTSHKQRRQESDSETLPTVGI